MQLPADKADVEVAVALAHLEPTQLEPYVSELLAWLMDGNWPVASPVAAALARCGLPLVEPVRRILSSDDDIWKYWVISRLLGAVDAQVRRALEPDLLRIVNQPTPGESQESVGLAARDVIFMLAYVDEP
jgi:Domain of unknown function (DUF5071)